MLSLAFQGLIPLLFFASLARGDRVDDLRKRIEDLESQQEESLIEGSDRRGEVNAFIKDHLTLGGFFESALDGITGPQTNTQIASNENVLGLNISALFSSHIRFVSQLLTGLSIPLQNEHNDPRAASFKLPSRREFGGYLYGSLIAQGYLEYDLTENVHLQGGLGYVPFGTAFQQRELVLFIRRGGPQLLRITNLVSPLWTGFHLYGNFVQKKNHWGYDAYTFTPNFNTRMLGLGGRFWWALPQDLLTAGVSAQIGKDNLDTFKAAGVDLRFKKRPWVLSTEYMRHFNTGNDPWSIYVEPSLMIHQETLLLYVFGDYAQSSQNMTGVGAAAIMDPYQKLEYGFGFNWLPTSFTRLRVGVTFNHYVGTSLYASGQNRDYTGLDLSAGVAF